MNKHALERGQTLPMVAVALILIVALSGLAADVGYHQYQQRVQQTATDSAALAAAAELDAGNFVTAGQVDAKTNGFAAGANGVTSVNIAAPPPADPYNGNPEAVEADIVASYPTFFERIFGIDSVKVSTKAVAIADAPSNWCLLALDTRGTSSINAHATINAPNCDIAVNNSHLSIGGQSTITTDAPIEYSGLLTGAGTSTFNPGPPVSALPASDPCPQIASCRRLEKDPPDTQRCQTFDPASIQPGTVYCSIDVSNKSVTFPPGWYGVTGDLKANHGTLSGNGVTFILTSTNAPNINNAAFDLTAPTSGDYNGMLFYAPNVTQPTTINSGDGDMQGVVYFPKSNLTLNAGATTQVIVISSQFSLNASDTTFLQPANVQITHPRLVE
ncbi:MAG TPA: pilus assembly protein TadG-related protein [Candidatus Baltobacteraceae bacterium]|nr:pilus assembly protein TadG-related protein [Candidatus Baltobacteraceae bacterium]